MKNKEKKSLQKNEKLFDNKDLIIFQVPYDFDPSNFDQTKLDLESNDFIEIKKKEDKDSEINFFMKREGLEGEKLIKEQYMIFNKGNEDKNYVPIKKKIKKVFKIIKSFEPNNKISKRAIIKTNLVISKNHHQ